MKLKWPGFDRDLVEGIEDYLGMDELTKLGEPLKSSTPGINIVAGRGRYGRRTHHHRPMFELLTLTQGSAYLFQRDSCPACDDWSRTTACDVHPELPLDDVLRRPDEFADQPFYGPENNPALPRHRPPPPVYADQPVTSYRAPETITALFAAYRFGFEVTNRGTTWTIVTDG